MNHINLNDQAFKSLFKFNMPLKAKAAANGAVIAEEIPTEKSPMATHIADKLPNTGANAGAISAAFAILTC